jgi:hypothetical protein
MSNNQTNFSEKVSLGDNFRHSKDNCNEDEHSIEPFVIFDYSIRSAQTKDSYFRRLRTFSNTLELKVKVSETSVIILLYKGRRIPNGRLSSYLLLSNIKNKE